MSASFSVIAGDPASAIVLHVPHASTVIPGDVRARILLDDEALAAELRVMTDAHTDLVAARASGLAARAPWQFVHRLSRQVVDPERFTEPGDEEMEAVGMGAVYTATHDGQRLRHDDPRHRADLLATYFTPYAEALAELVDQRLAARGRAVLVDLHSYPANPLPYERHAELRRPEICLGVDDGHTPAWLRRAAETAFAGFDLAVNAPFLGTYVPTRHYQRDLRVSSIMIEIRRDLYLGAGGDPLDLGVRKLASALATLFDAIDASDSAAKARRVPLPPIPVGATKEETKRTLGAAIRELFANQASAAEEPTGVRRRAAMEGFLHRWGGPEAVTASRRVDLTEPAAMVRVARALMDCVVRELLPLQHRDSPRAGAIATLATLAPIVDEPSRRAAVTLLASVREASGGTLALGSAAVALGHLERMTDAPSPAVIDEAWASLFYTAGPLHMAVARAARAGVSPETIRDALVEATRRLAA